MAGPRSPAKVSSRSWTAADAVDGAAFLVATALVVWLAVLPARDELRLSVGAVAYLVAFLARASNALAEGSAKLRQGAPEPLERRTSGPGTMITSRCEAS